MVAGICRFVFFYLTWRKDKNTPSIKTTKWRFSHCDFLFVFCACFSSSRVADLVISHFRLGLFRSFRVFFSWLSIILFWLAFLSFRLLLVWKKRNDTNQPPYIVYAKNDSLNMHALILAKSRCMAKKIVFLTWICNFLERKKCIFCRYCTREMYISSILDDGIT